MTLERLRRGLRLLYGLISLSIAVIVVCMVTSAASTIAYAQGQTESDQVTNDQAQKEEAHENVEQGKAEQSDGEPAEPTMLQMMAPALAPTEPNTMMRSISAKAKMNAAQSFMSVNPFSLRDMVNMMTTKLKVDEGLTLEEVVESMNLRANLLNMRLVGHNTPWKIMESISGEPMPKVEILSYCDVMTMRDILDYSPEFVAFLPCRISVIEDSAGDLWVVMLDWDVRWLDTSPNPNKMSEELRQKAIKIRDSLQSIMEAGAAGDL